MVMDLLCSCWNGRASSSSSFNSSSSPRTSSSSNPAQQCTLDNHWKGDEVIFSNGALTIAGYGTALAVAPLVQGKSYFEATIDTPGLMSVGVASRSADLSQPMGMWFCCGSIYILLPLLLLLLLVVGCEYSCNGRCGLCCRYSLSISTARHSFLSHLVFILHLFFDSFFHSSCIHSSSPSCIHFLPLQVILHLFFYSFFISSCIHSSPLLVFILQSLLVFIFYLFLDSFLLWYLSSTICSPIFPIFFHYLLWSFWSPANIILEHVIFARVMFACVIFKPISIHSYLFPQIVFQAVTNSPGV